jgi:hypothetical protein
VTNNYFTGFLNRFRFDSSWQNVERKDILNRISKGLSLMEKYVNFSGSDVWKLVKIDNYEKYNADAITIVPKRELHISPKCPWFTLLHELYHLMHAKYDFGNDLFEEGVAIAASTIVCRDKGYKTMYDFEDFDNYGDSLDSDPIVPFEQYLPLLPMRYSKLGKFWISAENLSPGVLKEISGNYQDYISLDLAERLEKLSQLIVNREIFSDFVNFYHINNRSGYLANFGTNKEQLTLSYDNVNKSLFISTYIKKKGRISRDSKDTQAILEMGVSKKLRLDFINKQADKKRNQPVIETDSSGHAAFGLTEIKNLIGESDEGYTLKVYNEANSLLLDMSFEI